MIRRATTTPSPHRWAAVVFGTCPALVLGGCATQSAIATDTVPGFLSGVLHGLIALPALLASLVLDVRVYAFPNNGFWYELGFCGGFVFGLGLLAVPVIPFIGGYLTRRN